MEVCRKLDNIKLENRPYTEVSPFDLSSKDVIQKNEPQVLGG